MIVIYSIHNKYDKEIYVGSTAKNYYTRFMEHQYNYNSGNFGCSSWKIMSRIKCSCGKFISRKNISTHKKSVSHFTRFDQLKNKTRKG